MGSASEQVKQQNQAKCGANRYLLFRGAVAFDSVHPTTGKDVVYLDLLFSDGLSFRLFNVGDAVASRSKMAVTLGALCSALGLDFNDLQGVFTWEDFAEAFQKFVEPGRYTHVYAKVTINKDGWPIFGTGRCFSSDPDLEYSDGDTMFLTTSEGDLAHPNERPITKDNDWGIPPF